MGAVDYAIGCVHKMTTIDYVGVLKTGSSHVIDELFEKGDVASIESLLRAKRDLDQQRTQYALSDYDFVGYLATSDNPKMTELLIKYFDVNVRSNDGFNALAYALNDGDYERALKLIDAGARSMTAPGALWYAVKKTTDHVSKLRMQREVIAKLAPMANLMERPLDDIEVGLKQVLLADLDRKKKPIDAKKAILKDAQERLKRANITVDEKEALLAKKREEYQKAITRENSRLSAKAVDVAEKELNEAKEYARKSEDDVEIAQRLLEETENSPPEGTIDIDWNARDNNGDTFIARKAFSNDFKDAIYLLVKEGADINALDVDGRTPLMHAAVIGAYAMAISLLDNGAKADIRDNEGKDVIQLATNEEDVKRLRAVYGFPRVDDKYTTLDDLIRRIRG